MVKGWTGAQPHQIWQPHYDNPQSFSDFQWLDQAIHQENDIADCSTQIDRNFY
ncbi:Glycosyl_hydrolase family 25 protein [Hexamita inflata]|uniref:Glycosyl hydrolase family 25 protein n=1 Tax=Hexamita inflata TaxID=28002 RepID=A0AA86QY75_9EUKA|nr:Glycosyl hydrolase family 25 protein [Hexamita inflata]